MSQRPIPPGVVPDLDQFAHHHPPRAHIPPDIRSAIRRAAVEAAKDAPDHSQNPIFRQWMTDVFLPKYREVLAEQRRNEAESTD